MSGHKTDTLGRTYTSIYADFAEPIGSHAAGIDNAGFTIYRCYSAKECLWMIMIFWPKYPEDAKEAPKNSAHRLRKRAQCMR